VAEYRHEWSSEHAYSPCTLSEKKSQDVVSRLWGSLSRTTPAR